MKNTRGRPKFSDILTPAEWRTVDAVRHGLTNRQIAVLEGISEDGVKYHVANAIAKLGLKNRKELKHWIGFPSKSNLISEEKTMQKEHKLLGLGQVSRSVKDVEKSELWYREVLGLKHLFSFSNMAFFDCYGVRLMLNQSNEYQAHESILYLRVANITATYVYLQEQGVKFINAPHMIHKHEDGKEEWMAFFNDLEGRPLAITSVN